MIIIFKPVNLEPEIITKHKLEKSKTKYFIDPSLNPDSSKQVHLPYTENPS
jgi:hypothetical protein